jgi:hypothetical protein
MKIILHGAKYCAMINHIIEYSRSGLTMKTRITALVLALLVSFALSACSEGGATPDNNTPASTPTPTPTTPTPQNTPQEDSKPPSDL